MAYSGGYEGGYADGNPPYLNAQLIRNPGGELVWRVGFPRIRGGHQASEGHEEATDVFRIAFSDYRDGTTDAVVAAAWVANSGAAIATLKTALHAALATALTGAPDGSTLP